jgi:hypothetical protein
MQVFTETLIDELSLSEVYTLTPHQLVYTLSDFLELHEAFQQKGFNVWTFTFTDHLNLVDTFRRAQESAWFDHLTLNESFDQGYRLTLSDKLNLIDSFVGASNSVFMDALILTDSFPFTVARNITLTDELVLDENFQLSSFAYAPLFPVQDAPVNSGASLPSYTPADPGTSYSPPAPTIPTIVLGYLTLPAPEFNDRDSYSRTRIQRTARKSKTVNQFQASYWPTEQKFLMNFTYLSETQARNLQYMLHYLAGKITVLVDYYGRTWNVVILTPDAEFIQNDVHSFAMDVEVQVVNP